jgi:plasmid maintenance system killer protein
MRLNDQWLLLLRMKKNEDGKQVIVISIVDYH